MNVYIKKILILVFALLVAVHSCVFSKCFAGYVYAESEDPDTPPAPSEEGEPETVSIIIRVTGNTASVSYNGQEQKVEGYALSCDTEIFDPAKVSYSGQAVASGSTVGTYKMGLSAGNFSYADSSVQASFEIVSDGELNIGKAAMTISITGNSARDYYDGTEKTVKGYTASSDSPLFDQSKLVCSVEPSVSEKEIGEYDLVLTADMFSYDDENVDVTYSMTNGKLIIEKPEIGISVQGHFENKTYSGDTYKVEGYEVASNSAGFDPEKVVFSGSASVTGMNAGSYMMGLSADQFSYDDPNVTAKFVVTDGGLEIAKAQLAITVTGHKESIKYDGAEHTVSGYDISCGSSLFSEGKVSYNGGTEIKKSDAGVYLMGLAADGFSYDDVNCEAVFTVTDGSLEIGRRTLVLTSESATKTYDGTALTNEKVTMTGDGFAEGEGAEYTASGSQTDAGSSPNTISCIFNGNTKGDNYELTKNEGTLTVTGSQVAITVTITENSGTEKYDGTEKTVTGYKVSIDNDKYTEKDFTFSGDATVKATDAGKHEMLLKPGDFTNTNMNYANVKFVIVDGHLEITKRKLTLTSESAEKPYDGEPLKSDKITIDGDGFAKGEGAKFEVTGSQTKQGSSANTFSYTMNENTKDSNYEITKVEGLLTVTAPVGPDTEPVSHLTIRKYTTSKPKNGTAYLPGEKISYMISMTNDGDVKITDIKVTDDLTGDVWTVDALEPGENKSFNTSYTVTEADAKAGSVVNTATATGYDQNGAKSGVTPGTCVEKAAVPEPEPEPVPAPEPPSGGKGSRAFMNLILTVLTGVMSLGMLISAFVRKENGDEQTVRSHKLMKAAGMLPLIGSVVTLILTRDAKADITAVDKWTILMAVFLIADAVLAVLSRNKNDMFGDDEQAE